MAFKHPASHHGNNTQHDVLLPHMTCVQRAKEFEHRDHFEKVSDDEGFTLKLIRLKKLLFRISAAL